MYDINTGHKFLDVGVFGLSRIGSELSRNGASAQAFGLFTKKGENSFGVMVDSLKVTTLWEILPVQSDIYAKSHGSHNHPMQGGYESWILEDVAGLRPVEENPGFKTVMFYPRHTADLESHPHPGGRRPENLSGTLSFLPAPTASCIFLKGKRQPWTARPCPLA